MQDWLTAAEAAEELGVTVGRVRQLIAGGVIQVTKRGNTNFMQRSELDKVRDRGKPGRQKKERPD